VSLGSIELSIDSPPTSDVGAQFVNQVLSDVLVDPPEVLSAMGMCCQSACVRTSAMLGGLLIKLFLLFGQLDSEEGLHAGMEVESFTSPVGPDRLGVGVVEAVHRCQQIMLLRLLPAAQREVDVPGQVLIADPPITWLAVRFGEHPAFRSVSDADTTFVDGGVMPLTKQDQILQVRATAKDPRDHMMGFQMSGLVAAGVLTHPIADEQRPALRLADQSTSPAQGQHLAVLVDKGAEQRVVAGQFLRSSRLDRTRTTNVDMSPRLVESFPRERRGDFW
jgi:hypothetical protein